MNKFIKNFFFKLGLKDSPGKLKKHTKDVPLIVLTATSVAI